ncbi:ABC transporter ATP-binding protein, partial [Brucella pituitosa]|nr:ABC transporter ATP-binding protein [Brucella pituitosa]
MANNTQTVTALREAGPDVAQTSTQTVLSARGLGKSFGGFHA